VAQGILARRRTDERTLTVIRSQAIETVATELDARAAGHGEPSALECSELLESVLLSGEVTADRGLPRRERANAAGGPPRRRAAFGAQALRRFVEPVGLGPTCRLRGDVWRADDFVVIAVRCLHSTLSG
jgi:hypothetical protein